MHSFDHRIHFLFNSHTLRNLQDKFQGFRIGCRREICRTLTIKLCLITSHFNISCVTQAQFFLYRCAFRNWLIVVSIQFHFLFLNCHNFYATHLKTYSWEVSAILPSFSLKNQSVRYSIFLFLKENTTNSG